MIRSSRERVAGFGDRRRARSGSGSPGGASRRRSWPGAVRAAVTSMRPPATGYPTGPLGIAEHTTASAKSGCRIGSGVRCPRCRTTRPPERRPWRRFARIVALPETELDLAIGALTIASDGRPDVDPAPTLAILDSLAERARVRLDVGDAEDGRDRPAPRRALSRDRLPRADRRGVPRPRATRCSTSSPGAASGCRSASRSSRSRSPAGSACGSKGIGLPGHFIVGGRRRADRSGRRRAAAAARRLPGADPAGRRRRRAVPLRDAPAGRRSARS